MFLVLITGASGLISCLLKVSFSLELFALLISVQYAVFTQYYTLSVESLRVKDGKPIICDDYFRFLYRRLLSKFTS